MREHGVDAGKLAARHRSAGDQWSRTATRAVTSPPMVR
jgi:hypothetical protein